MKKLFLTLVALIPIATLSGITQAQELEPLDADQILAEIEQICGEDLFCAAWHLEQAMLQLAIYYEQVQEACSEGNQQACEEAQMIPMVYGQLYMVYQSILIQLGYA